MSTIYNYHNATGEYIGEQVARLDPIEGIPLVPAHATTIQPILTPSENEALVFNVLAQEWSIMADFRGESYYLEDGTYYTISAIGEEKPENALEELPTFPPTLEEQRQAAMLEGVEFEGVMCSAFKEDQWGLASLKEYITAGNDVDFLFENENTLTLTSDNLAAFEAVWIPFRQAHTKNNFTGS